MTRQRQNEVVGVGPVACACSAPSVWHVLVKLAASCSGCGRACARCSG